MKKTVKKITSEKKSENSSSGSLYDMRGKKIGDVQLDNKLFDGGVNVPLMHQAVLMYQARGRAGTSSTKTCGEVRGGGKKPWRQKGTGRARAGSIRSPLWRGGGTVFGPHPRDYSYNIPARMKKEALKCGLNSKVKDNKFQVLDKIELKEPKTKLFKAILDSLKINGSSLVIVDKIDENIKKAARNIPKVSVKTSTDFNIMDVLRHDNFLITETALKDLSKRF